MIVTLVVLSDAFFIGRGINLFFTGGLNFQVTSILL